MGNNKNASFEDFDETDDEVVDQIEQVDDEMTQAPTPKGRGEVASPVKGMAVESGIKNTTQLMTDDAKLVKDQLAKEPTTEIYIPLSSGEKLGQAYETVTINGYRLEIKKGYMVEVPKTVARMIRKYLNIQTSVDIELRLENKSEDVRTALS
jgi:hypothetical protein